MHILYLRIEWLLLLQAVWVPLHIEERQKRLEEDRRGLYAKGVRQMPRENQVHRHLKVLRFHLFQDGFYPLCENILTNFPQISLQYVLRRSHLILVIL